MSAATPVLNEQAIRRPQADVLRIFAKEAKYEFLKSIRLPIFAVSTLSSHGPSSGQAALWLGT